MKTRLRNQWEKVRSSYWFVPSVLAGLAVALALGAVALDAALGQEWVSDLGWIYPDGPEGARSLLSTVAGAMITVAGVVFSVTVVALSLASQQFGPRLLHNFMRDRGNQVVLGTFVATYLYCLLVLRAIRGGGAGFVPHVSITLGFSLALLSLGVLIYFIHHVSESIQVTSVISAVGRDLESLIDRFYPEGGGEEEEEDDCGLPPGFDAQAEPVGAGTSGYVQAVDLERLVDLAAGRDLLVHVERRPGKHVVRGEALVRVWPPGRVGGEVARQVRGAFVLGHRRSWEQDVEFQIHELVELAVRALSPGVNDPFTALSCVDSLTSALCELARRPMPGGCRRDGSGMPRVFLHPVTYAGAADAAFDQIRQYGRTSAAVTIRLLEAIATIAPFTRTEEQRQALRRHAAMVERGSHDLPEENDRADARERYQVALRALEAAPA